MAVVGEAKIIVKAITTGVGEEISRSMSKAERSIGASGDRMGKNLTNSMGRSVSKNKGWMDKLFDPAKAEKTREAWVALQKTGFLVQTGVGGLTGSVGALVGGLGALVGVAGGAAGALAAVGGAAVGVGIGMKLANLALGGIGASFKKATTGGGALGKTIAQVREEMQQLRFDQEDAAIGEKEAALNLEKARDNLARLSDLPPNSTARRQAELEFAKADLAMRKAIDRNKDLQKEIKTGVKTSATGAVDPYKGLTESQKEFAKALVALKPKFQELKEAVAKGFLPALRTQIDDLFKGNSFTTIKSGFSEIGRALGGASTQVGTFVNSSKGIGLIGSALSSSAKTIGDFGSIATDLLGSFLTVLKAAEPITRKFTSFLSSKTTALTQFLDAKSATKNGTSDLEKFFTRAGEIAAGFGKVFGNIFKGLGKIISANFEPGSGGDKLLTWLQSATDKFANLDKTVGGAGALKSWFSDVSDNFIALAGLLGSIVTEILKLGAMEELKQAFDIAKGAAPALGEIAKNGVLALPSLAKLVVSLAKIGAVLADSGAIKVFFGTLNTVAEKVSAFLENDTVKSVLNVISKVTAFGLALGVLGGAALKVGRILFASFAMFGPVAGPIVAIVAAIATGLAVLYQTNDKARGQMDAMFKQLSALGGAIMDMFSKLGTELMPVMLDLGKTVTDALMGILPTLMEIIPIIGGVIRDIIPFIGELVKVAVPAFGQIIAAILPLVATLLKELIPVFGQIMKAILPVVSMIISSLVPVFTQIMDAVTNLLPTIMYLVSSLIDALMPSIQVIISAIMPLISAIAELLIPIIETLVQVLTPVIQVIIGIAGVIAGVLAAAIGIIAPILTGIIKIFTAIVKIIQSVVGPAFQGLAQLFATVFQGIAGIFKGVMNAVMGVLEGAINWMIDGINGLLGALNVVLAGIKTATGGAINIKLSPLGKVKFPKLADGGTVMPSAGGSIVNVAEAGKPERIEPLDPNGLSARDKAMIAQLSGGGKGTTINVYPSQGMNEKELAEIVSRKLAFEMRRGGL